MDYEKAYKETLDNLQVMVNKGKITENVAKRICSGFKLESENERIRKEVLRIVDTWTATCFKVNGIPRENLLAWVEKKDTKNTTELPNGEDYGIDGMSAAIDILQKTLGDVEGYQTDDGILEHKCAISAVKELSKKETVEPFTIEHGKFYYCIKDYFSGGHKRASKGDVVQALNGLSMMGLTSEEAAVYFRPVNKIEQKPAEWTDEDEEMVEDIIDSIPSIYAVSDYNEMVGWLKEVKNRIKPQEKREWNEVDKSSITHCQESLNYYYRNGMITVDEYNSAKNLLNSLIIKAHWKPTIDQLYAIQTAVSHLDNTPYYEINELKSLHEDLKKLG